MAEERDNKPKIGCKECKGTGFILEENYFGQPKARRCDCYKRYLESQERKKEDKSKPDKKKHEEVTEDDVPF